MTNENIIGWVDPFDVASSLISLAAHDILLRGDLVFAFRNQGGQHIVIVKNKDLDSSYGLSIVCDSYTVVYPRVPQEFAQGEAEELLKSLKVNKTVLETLKKNL